MLAPEPVLPARSGLPLRVLHLVRALAAATDTSVTALGSGVPPEHDEEFDLRHVPGTWSRTRAVVRATHQPWQVAQVASPAMSAVARDGAWDTVQAHTLALLGPALCSGRPVVLDAHDAVSEVAATMARADTRRGMRPLWRFERLKSIRAERRAARSAAAVSVPSQSEAELFESLGARTLVVPNGVAVDDIPHAPPPEGKGVLFAGYFRWRPNVEAALELIEDVFPRIRARLDGATLRLVGKDAVPGMTERAGPGVEIVGGVEEMLPELRRAAVTVLPIRAGGGTRLKALEALAAGVPVVATPFAVHGLGLRDGEHALLADRPADLAEQAVRVIGDRALAAELSQRGRAHVEARFDWPAVAAPLVELHHDLAGISCRA